MQPGRTVPPKTTLFIALRSIAISNALRRLAFAAIGVPTFEYGLQQTVLVPDVERQALIAEAGLLDRP